MVTEDEVNLRVLVFLLIFLGFMFVIGIIISPDFSKVDYYKTFDVRSEDLIILKTSSSTGGSFFLGIGSLYDEEYYVYNYIRDSELIQEKLPKSPSVHIFIDEEIEKPVIKWSETYAYVKKGEEFLERKVRSEINFFIPSDNLVQRIDI